MSFVRRLVRLCLTLAFAGYGLIAAAPAHAHGDNHGYTIYAVAWDADLVGNHHADEDRGQGNHDATDHEGDVVGNVGGPTDHGGLHVHAVAAFITVSGPSPVPQLISTSVVRWVERSAGDVFGLFSPLKKPPRTFL